MTEPADLTAHEILATHVTNVSKVTATVIERACADHANLQLACKELTARVAALEALAASPAPDDADPMACVVDAFAALSMAAASATRAFSRLRHPPVPVLVAGPQPLRQEEIYGGAGTGVLAAATAYAMQAQPDEDVVADLKASFGETNGTASNK
jgi:hypothetical protein